MPGPDDAVKLGCYAPHMSEAKALFAHIGRAIRDFLHPEPTEPGFRKEDLTAHGFPVDMGKLALATALETSVYEGSEEAIRERWGKLFDSICIKEIEEVENRYVLFTQKKSRRQYVAIRGTANLSNLMYDLRFFKKVDPALGIGAHEGFMKLARVVYEDLKPQLLPGYRLHLIGHSLGAAEAVLLGMLLADEGRDVCRVVALGLPKATDAEGWALHGALPVVQVVAPFDPIPFLPPRNLLYKSNPYTHGANLLMLLDGNHAAAVPAAFYDDMTQTFMEAWGTGKRFDMPDHQIGNYRARIGAKKDGTEFVPGDKWLDYATPTDAKVDTFEVLKGWIRRPKSAG